MFLICYLHFSHCINIKWNWQQKTQMLDIEKTNFKMKNLFYSSHDLWISIFCEYCWVSIFNSIYSIFWIALHFITKNLYCCNVMFHESNSTPSIKRSSILKKCYFWVIYCFYVGYSWTNGLMFYTSKYKKGHSHKCNFKTKRIWLLWNKSFYIIIMNHS